MTWGILKKDSVADAIAKIQSEALTAKQKKIDLNKNGKIDGEDLSKLRKEDAEQVEEGWDDMLKYAKEKNGPQPNGGAGKKQGTRYGGGKQKDDETEKRKQKNEEVELEELDDGSFYDGSDMLGEAQERYSSSYQFTHKPGDAESEKKLADLKAQHKGTGKRVVLQGRLGKDNPNAHKYSKAMQGKPGSASTGGHTHQRIKKADAAHHDVYVYDKADTEYTYDEMIAEVLSKDASAGKWIGDFVKSDAPQFAGKSPEKRKQMALAAYYAAQKKESTDYESFIELDEEADLVKTGAKEIKHANIKDKQDDQDTMEPRAKGERDFLDKLSVNVTDDPAKDGVNTGASKLSHASEPKAQGAGKYDAKEKLGKQGVKEASDCGTKAKGKKTFSEFKKARSSY